MQSNRYSVGIRPGRKRRRIRARFFIFLLVFLGLVVLGGWGLSFLIGGDSLVTLSYGRLRKDDTAQALILRREEVVGEASYSRVQYQAIENQLVQEGDVILTTYSQGYSSSVVEELNTIRQQIAQLQEEKQLSGIMDPNVERFDELITEKIAAVGAFAGGERNGVNLVDLERELRDYAVQRQEFIKNDNKVSGDAELNDLYNREAEAQIKVESWRKEHKAAVFGRVSYFFDNYEYVLKPDNLSGLTTEMVANMLKDTVAPTIPPEEKDKALPPLYRIVTPDEWYALLIVNEAEWSFAGGTQIEISFQGYDDLMFSANIKSITGNGDQALVVLQMSEDIDSLISARKATAIIGGRVEGLIVPQRAIKNNGTQQGVYLEDGQTFVPVEVLAKDKEGQALVMPMEEGALQPDMKVRGK